MIQENSTNNELNIFTGMTDSTLMIMQEFLTVIENATMLTTDIAKRKGEDLSSLAYEAYVNNYEVFRNRVCQEDAAIFEKLINYICMSSHSTISITKFPAFKNNYYISDYGQFGSDCSQSTFNTQVGIEYKLCYKTETYTGVFSASGDSAYKSNQYKLSAACSNLFSQQTMKKISDGLIKVNRFKDGSFIKMKFLINSQSLDEFKINIHKILNEDLFKKWSFKGLCNDIELLSIRYIYKIKADLEHSCSAAGDASELKSIDLLTYKCINWVIKTMHFRATSGLHPTSGVLKEIASLIISICIHYFIPNNDKEFFYKFTNYITYATPSESTMGYNGLSETNREKAISILENMGKMERMLGRVLYDKGISKKDMNLKLNTFNSVQPLCLTTLSEVNSMIEYVTNLESYKAFIPGNTNDDSSFLTNTTKVEPFKHLGISEEGMYLALLAVKSLYDVPDRTIRDNARTEIIKRAKKFVDANDYEKFSEIIVKFTVEEDNAFCYVPSSRMNLNVKIYDSFNSYFTDDMFIQKVISQSHTFRILVDNTPSLTGKTINSTNNLLRAYQEINQFFLKGLVVNHKNEVLESINDCFIAITPSIQELSWDFSENSINKCAHLRNKKIADLVSSVLDAEYGYMASPKEGIEYEEMSFINTNNEVEASLSDSLTSSTSIVTNTTAIEENNSYSQQTVTPTPITDMVNGAHFNNIESNAINCVAHQSTDTPAIIESTSFTDTTNSQNVVSQQADVANNNEQNDLFTFNWLSF